MYSNGMAFDLDKLIRNNDLWVKLPDSLIVQPPNWQLVSSPICWGFWSGEAFDNFSCMDLLGDKCDAWAFYSAKLYFFVKLNYNLCLKMALAFHWQVAWLSGIKLLTQKMWQVSNTQQAGWICLKTGPGDPLSFNTRPVSLMDQCVPVNLIRNWQWK